MKTILKSFSQLVIALVFIIVASCNSGDTNTNTSDTAQHVPGTNDSIPAVVNPGTGDTSAVMTTPSTNDNNTIMPDSTSIAQ